MHCFKFSGLVHIILAQRSYYKHIIAVSLNPTFCCFEPNLSTMKQMVELGRSAMEVHGSANIAQEKALVGLKILGNRSSRTGTERNSSVVSACSASRSVKESKVHINTAFSMMSLFKICSSMSNEKREISQFIGFGNLMKLPEYKQFPRQICLWLLSRLDTTKCAMKHRNGELLPFGAEDVALVLGISSKGECVVGECSIPCTTSTLLLLRGGEEPTLKTLESILSKEIGRRMTSKEKEEFKLAFVLYVDAVFLGAKGSNPKVNNDPLKKCSDTTVIPKLNWSDYVVCCLKDSARKVQLSLLNGKMNVTIEGCLFFLLVS